MSEITDCAGSGEETSKEVVMMESGFAYLDKDIVRQIKLMQSELTMLKEQNKKLRECVSYYANTEIYNRPDKDRNGMGGMSSMTDFELDDGEWKLDNSGEKDHYCYGKLARKCLEEIAGMG